MCGTVTRSQSVCGPLGTFQAVWRTVQAGCRAVQAGCKAVQAGWRAVQASWRTVQAGWRAVQATWRAVKVAWRAVQASWKTVYPLRKPSRPPGGPSRPPGGPSRPPGGPSRPSGEPSRPPGGPSRLPGRPFSLLEDCPGRLSNSFLLFYSLYHCFLLYTVIFSSILSFPPLLWYSPALPPLSIMSLFLLSFLFFRLSPHPAAISVLTILSSAPSTLALRPAHTVQAG